MIRAEAKRRLIENLKSHLFKYVEILAAGEYYEGCLLEVEAGLDEDNEALIVYMKLKEPKGSIVYIYEAPTSVRIVKSCLDGDENE